MNFKATTPKRQFALEAAGEAEARATIQAECKSGQVFALQRRGGKVKFFLIRNTVAYPISAAAAAVEMAMDTAR